MAAATLPLLHAPPVLAARTKTIRVADASIVEGDAGQQNLAFRITWSGSKGGAGPSVQYATADVTATAGSDYTSTSGTANLTNGGCRCATVNVPVQGDAITEGTETFELNLSNPVNATITDSQAIGTIIDNEGPSSLVVSDTSANEADGSLGFSVVLTNPSASTVTVEAVTADGTASAGTDYTAATGITLTYTPGQTSKSVVVTVADDALAEEDETVLLNLSNAANATIVDAQGVGSLINDDADPTATIGPVSVAEGDAASATATFTVSLDGPSGRETAVDVATSDGTATAGADYAATSGTLTIAAGDTSATFEVPVIGETLYEGDETFTVTLSGEVNLTPGATTAEGTITDDDPVPTLAAQNIAVGESAGKVTVTLALSNPSAADVTADWSTVAGTATEGMDFTAGSGSLSIPAGTSSVTVDVTILGDARDEPNEKFQVAVSNTVNASAGANGTVTVTDDDKTPTALTLRLVNTTKVVKAKGVLETAAAGVRVKVTLQRKKGTRWVRVAVKAVTVKGLRDRDGDGKLDAAYLAAFPKPAEGRYRFRAVFAGTAQAKASSQTLAFRI